MTKNETDAAWESAEYNTKRAEKAELECDKLRQERDYYRKDNDRLINALAIEHSESQRLREAFSGAAALQEENERLRKLMVRLYNSGYSAGHDATVEGGFVDILPADMDTYHAEEVAEWLDGAMK